MNETHPKVIVLVLSYNGKHLLHEALTSYLANDYPNFETVVIDNASTDETGQFVKENFPAVKVVRIEKNLGYSGGLNVGLDFAFKKGNADYALITNNDVKADERIISELVNVAKTDQKIGFVVGKVYYYDRPDIFQTVGIRYDSVCWHGGNIGAGEKDRGQYDEVCERYFADDVYMLVSKTLYEAVGGYEADFKFQCEEYDWQARAKKAGYKIMYTPHAKIWHKAGATLGRTSALKLYYDTRNPMVVVMVHQKPKFFRKYFWFHLYNGTIVVSVKYLLRIKIVHAFAVVLGFSSGLLWGLRNKKLTLRHFI